MLGSDVDMKLVKYGAICILSVIALIIIFIFKLITGSYLIGTLFFIVLLWLLIFKIGITIMYPGSSNYYKSDIEIRVGNQIEKNLSHLGHCFQFIAECVATKNVPYNSTQWNLKDKVIGSINTTIEMLSMFENSLSQRKAKMLQIFRKISQEIQYKCQSNSQQQTQIQSIADFLQNPKKIRQIKTNEYEFLCIKIQRILQLNNEFQQLIITYKPPQAALQFLKYQFFQQKLYEIRFGFQRWNHMFGYEVHLINNVGYILECAIIKGQRQNQQNIQPNGKYILFCNPNGVFIQFFAVENCYIREYLKQGYQVILWNYRGYGQSTGSPSITKSQSDAMKVYNYFTDKGLNIEIVHGYSIGGAAAIGLVSKLQNKEKSLNKNQSQSISSLRGFNNSKNVKLLIVDRSFSSIGDMAIQFGPTLHKLARIVFTFENKNLSKQYKQLKTQKLMIWDKRDEVIPDTASVKGGMLMQFLHIQEESSCSKNCSNCLKTTDQITLNQEMDDQDDHDLSSFNDKLLKKFSSAIKTLLKYTCEIQSKNQNQLNFNHEYDPTELHQKIGSEQLNDNLNISEQIVQRIMKTIQMIDGGGSYLPMPTHSFKKLLLNNPIVFEFKCHSYLLGLTIFGSVVPIQIAFENRNKIQSHTLKKIQGLIQDLLLISKQFEGNNKILQPELSKALDNIIKTFTEAKKIIQKTFLLNQNNKFGKLIACSNGHNGSLPQDQLNLLLGYIKMVCDSNNGLREHNQNLQNHIGYDKNPNNVYQKNHQQQQQNFSSPSTIQPNSQSIEMSMQMNASRYQQ